MRIFLEERRVIYCSGMSNNDAMEVDTAASSSAQGIGVCKSWIVG